MLRFAYERGALAQLPVLPKQRRNRRDGQPRPAFTFAPLVSEDDDEVVKLLAACKQMAQDGIGVRGVGVTSELGNVVCFPLHSFVRPTLGELYSIWHEGIQIKPSPQRLTLRIRLGKTGVRYIETLAEGADVYRRIMARHPDHQPADYIFLPEYNNRETAKRMISRQFSEALERSGLRLASHRKDDPILRANGKDGIADMLREPKLHQNEREVSPKATALRSMLNDAIARIYG